MKPYLAHTENALRLLSRNKTALFFNYLFPLIFFFLFAALFGGAKNGGAMLQVISTVLTLGVLGNGLMGAGLTTVQEREENILRRFKVTPSGARPILFAIQAAGLIAYLPLVAGIIAIAHVWLHVPIPPRVVGVIVFSGIGLLAFRGLGLLLASVVNSTQEGTAVVQMIYIPMLMLSGAMMPLEILPSWLQKFSGFLPSAYLYSGMQSMLVNGQDLWHNVRETLALLATAAATTFLALKLFRWDKDEAAPPKAKWWLIAGLAPFVVLGLTQMNSQARLDAEKMQTRAVRRARTFVVENVRVFVGDGAVIEHGRVLVKNGRIVEVGEQGSAESPKDAEVVNGAGKTLLPGLIDMHVHLGASGFLKYDADEKDPEAHRLAHYLYCGVTAVRSVGDWTDRSLALKQRIASGQLLGAELFAYGPLFTAEGGHGTEYLNAMPASMRPMARDQFLRIPKNPADAEKMVHGLKGEGVDGIKAILQGDFGNIHFVRLERPVYEAVARAAHAEHLPLATHTNTLRDVEDAIAVHSDSIEHGSLTDLIPPADFAAMRDNDLAYDPTLSVVAIFRDLAAGSTTALDSPLLQQIVPAKKMDEARKAAAAPRDNSFGPHPEMFTNATANLLGAWHGGVRIIAGSDAGNPYIIHGPTVQRELALWVEAGIPATVALQAATGQAAKVLRAENRLGLIAPAHEATFILVEGDPVADIHALDRISSVVFRGEMVNRADLLKSLKEP